MTLSAFPDESHHPRPGELIATLGSAHSAWVELPELLSGRLPEVSEEWGFTSASTGWGLRVKSHGRVILYMTPCHGHFIVSLALGERAVKAAHASGLPPSALSTIDAAPKLAEGRGVRFEVRDARQLDDLVTLAEIKNAH